MISLGYLKLWFHFKSDLRIACYRNNGGNYDLIITYSSLNNDDILHIID